MGYLWEKSQEVLHNIVANGSLHIPIVDDIIMSWNFLGAILDGDITQHNIVPMVLLDGSQLYNSKESDCWTQMYI